MLMSDFSEVLSSVLQHSSKPRLFEQGEEHFWDDPHISQSMLEAHLDPTHDAASRRPQTIDKTIDHLVQSKILKPGNEVLDLGCGPGLYASRLGQQGMGVTGIDISARSIEYARNYALQHSLNIDYRIMDFFEIKFQNKFDAALQIYGELCTLSDEKRDDFLAKVHQSLKPEGLFIFDVSCRMVPATNVNSSHWDIGEGGFWRPGRHLVLEQNYTYPEQAVCLHQNMVIDNEGTISIYRNWFHDYTLQSLTPVLEKAGFHIEQVWNDLTGSPYQEGGDWMALVAKKV